MRQPGQQRVEALSRVEAKDAAFENDGAVIGDDGLSNFAIRQVERENETTGRVAGRFQKAPGYAAGELRLDEDAHPSDTRWAR